MPPPLLYVFLLYASFALAFPAPLQPREDFSALSSDQVNALGPFASFAAAGYCSPSKTSNWTCGANCDANPNFKPITSGGDGNDVQFFFVGFDPDLATLIVSHQGTDPSEIMPLLTDADILQESLDTSLFAGIPNGIKVHGGFKDSQAEAASQVLAAVTQGSQQFNTNKVTVVGHSLGGAIALLDGIFLQTQNPALTVQVITYGMPRVGNQPFADFVDANVNLQRVTNKKDPVPILPGRFLDYHHPSHEVHIQSEDSSFVACPGQDNDDERCSVGDAPNIFESRLSDHQGPYVGVIMKCPD